MRDALSRWAMTVLGEALKQLREEIVASGKPSLQALLCELAAFNTGLCITIAQVAALS
jgi:hypothetical protein